MHYCIFEIKKKSNNADNTCHYDIYKYFKDGSIYRCQVKMSIDENSKLKQNSSLNNYLLSQSSQNEIKLLYKGVRNWNKIMINMSHHNIIYPNKNDLYIEMNQIQKKLDKFLTILEKIYRYNTIENAPSDNIEQTISMVDSVLQTYTIDPGSIKKETLNNINSLYKLTKLKYPKFF